MALFFELVVEPKCKKVHRYGEIETVIKKVYGSTIGEITHIKDEGMNKCIFIENKKRKKLLKIYCNWFNHEKENRDFINSVISWMDFFRKKKGIVGRIYPTKDGKDYLKVNNHFAVLHEYVEGGVFGGTKKEIKNTAKILAEIHTALRGYRKVMYTRKFRKNINEKWKFLNLSGISDPEVDRFFKNIEDDVNLMNSTLKNKDYDKLETLYIHGDFNFNHVIYERGRVKTIFDFDSIMYCPKIFDLATSLVSLTFKENQKWEENIKTFYDEYKKNISLNKIESEMVFVFMKLYLIKQISSRLKQLNKKNGVILTQKFSGGGFNGGQKKTIIPTHLYLIKHFNWIKDNEKKIKKIIKSEEWIE